MSYTQIPNQRIWFPALDDDCNPVIGPAYCTKVKFGDLVQYQWQRGPCSDNLLCGLLEALGNEKITNGNFLAYPFDNGWTFTEESWSWDTASFFMCPQVDEAQIDAVIAGLITGNQYIVTITLFGNSAGTTVTLYIDNGPPVTVTGPGTHTVLLIAGDSPDTLTIVTNAGFDGCIQSVSLKDPCITSVGWTLGEDGEICNNFGNNLPITLNDTTVITPGNEYQVRIVTNTRTAGQLTLAQTAGPFAVITDGDHRYTFIAVDNTLLIRPSVDYNGCIISIEVYEMKRLSEVVLTSSETGPVDLSNNIVYTPSHATLNFFFTIDEQSEDLYALFSPAGCYTLEYTDPCTEDEFASECIDVQEQHDCTKLFQATCDCIAYGFNFAVFTLSQRVPVLTFNPSYPRRKQTYLLSDGTIKKQYVELRKVYDVLLDYVPEPVHDCMAVQLDCDTLLISSSEFYFEASEYSPEWPKDGRQRNVQARFEVLPSPAVLFNNNCLDCDTPDGPPVLLLQCTFGELISDTFFLDATWQPNSTLCWVINVFEVDGDSVITGTPQYCITADGAGIPDLNNQAGVVNPSVFPQVLSTWLNTFNPPKVIFYDNMNLVEKGELTTFLIEVTRSDGYTFVATDESFTMIPASGPSAEVLYICVEP